MHTLLDHHRLLPFVAAIVQLAAGAVLSATAADSFRVATFNVSLYGQKSGEVLERLRSGTDSQAQHVAEIIQRVRPDVLLVNEIDYDPQGEVLKTFCEKYLAVGQHVSKAPAGPAKPIEFPHRWAAPSNTGRSSGFDLNRDGKVETTSNSDAYAGDCWGYGRYEGQYALAVLSRFPIDTAGIRTFREFRWKDMPGAKLPDDASTPAPADWYGAHSLEKFPLSSKNHCDVPVTIDGRTIHLLVSHPTPPVYDGAEDRNGRRNHDEIRFWADYIGPAEDATYIQDDSGFAGGLEPQASSLKPSFIILGDLNSDPNDGDGPEGISLLLNSPSVLQYEPPMSAGAAEQARLQGGANLRHRGKPEHDTCDPADDPGPGNLRIDYVLPSAELAVSASGVFWPAADDPLFPLVGVHPFPGSDHRLVWADVEL